MHKWLSREEFRAKLIREATPSETTVAKTLMELSEKPGLEIAGTFQFQYPVGPYYADFYFETESVLLEIDGAVHETPEAIEHDRIRNKYMVDHGLMTFRIKNIEAHPITVHVAVSKFLEWLINRKQLAISRLQPRVKTKGKRVKKSRGRKYITYKELRTGSGTYIK
jgi:very-short-patch-repair endonuclease